MAYFKDIKESVQKYKEARKKRKEVEGPTLFDTAIDITKRTGRGMKSTYRDSVNKYKDMKSRYFIQTSKGERVNWDAVFDRILEAYDNYKERKMYRNVYDYKTGKNYKIERDETGDLKLIEDNPKVQVVKTVKDEFKYLQNDNVQDVVKEEILEEFEKEENLVQELEEPEKEELIEEPEKEENLVQEIHIEREIEQEEVSEDKQLFAQMYQNVDDREVIKKSINAGDDYEDVINVAESTSPKFCSNLGENSGLYWRTLRGGSLDTTEMNEIVLDVDELDNIYSQLKELDDYKNELLAKRNLIENKYKLLSPEERVNREYGHMLEASNRFIETQIKHSKDLGLNKEELIDNQILTLEELNRVDNGELISSFQKKEAIEELEVTRIKNELENEVKFTSAIEKLDEVAVNHKFNEDFIKEEVEKFVEIDKEIAEESKRKYTRDWSIQH